MSQPQHFFDPRPKFPIELNLQGTRCVFDWENATWVSSGARPSEVQPSEDEVTQLRQEVKNLELRNEILLDMLTVKELDLQKARQLKKEIEDLVNPSLPPMS